MNRENNNGDYYNLIYKNFINYLAITFFLEQDEEPPEEPDLLGYIVNAGRENELIDFLVLNIHRLVFVENYRDEMRTTFSLHLQNIINRKV